MRLPSEYSLPVLLGKGASSSVYRVYQQRIDRTVAVKIFRNSPEKNIKAVCSEVQILGKLSLPCVPHVYDISFKRSQAFIVMEWVRGVPLDRLLQSPLSLSLRQTIATKIIEAIALLHEHNIVHKDLKPQNIIITPDNRVYLIDFGFASDNKPVVSQNTTIQGTMRYIAPELWQYDKPVNFVKNDIYALGILLNDLLGSDIPEHLNQCSSQDPSNRPETVQEFFSSWKSSTCFSTVTSEWYPVISTATQEYLAAQFIAAAQNFKRKGQIKNAYQILAELLDEIPDHPEAIAQLQSLSISKSKQNYTVINLSLVFVLVIGVLSFFAGRFFSESESTNRFQMYNKSSNDSLITLFTSAKKVSVSQTPLFKNDNGISLIKAELFCLLPDTFGSLFIDGKKIDSLSVIKYPEIQLKLNQGVHSIRWISNATASSSIETVTLKPFERKRIKLTLLKE